MLCMRTTKHDTVNSRFYAPLEAAIAQSTFTRNCPGFPDDEFLEAGVGRVIDDAFTGRAWVQKLQQLVHIGIESDELVGAFCGVMLRRINYRDPADGKLYVFMTNEMTLPPGLIAFLYKLRWDIEKVFDEKKNKLHEKKAWADPRNPCRCESPPPVPLDHPTSFGLLQRRRHDGGRSGASGQGL